MEIDRFTGCFYVRKNNELAAFIGKTTCKTAIFNLYLRFKIECYTKT